MPYLSVRTTVPLNADQKNDLQQILGELIAVIPGKSADNCMIDIQDSVNLYMRGGALRGAFVDLRLFKASPDEAKREFLGGLARLFAERLAIEKKNVYCNIVEMDQWGSGDNLLT